MLLPMILLTLIMGGCILVITIPHHFYQEAIQNGVVSPFITLRKLPERFYEGSFFSLENIEGYYNEDAGRWKDFHFENYLLPMPVRHPLYLVIPQITDISNGVEIGYKLIGHSKKEISKFEILKFENFKLDFISNRIFSLPYFQNYIMKKGIDQIWKDIFSLNFLNDPFLKTPPLVERIKFWEYPFQEMVYRLFILNMRMRVLPLNLEKIEFFQERRLGIIQVKDEEARTDGVTRFKEEIIFLLENDQIHKLKIRSRYEDKGAQAFRKKILESISHKSTDQLSSSAIYNEYLQLSYQQKLDQEGMVYLFSAWTHEKENRNFIREMIRFLERGKQEKEHLDPLYDYAFKKFGSNFSTEQSILKESEEEKLKRKIEEETKEQVESVIKRNVVDSEGEFSSDEEKINFYLQKAKDSGIDTGKDEDIIIVD